MQNQPVLWVDDGTRTRDPQDHNPMLYQLSYIHHVSLPLICGQAIKTTTIAVPAFPVNAVGYLDWESCWLRASIRLL
jgi:hypothetical protein